jgi:hypothetical protein
MIRRRVIAPGVVFAGVLISGIVTAGTAAAVGPVGTTSGGGCNGGGSCWTNVGQYIQLSGNGYTGGAGNAGVAVANIPPPPCWMQAAGTGQQIANWWKGYTKNGDPMVIPAFSNYVNSINQHKNAAASAGQWYEPVENPSAPPDGASCVARLPLLQWVPAGTPPPLPWIPPQDLAMYALANMHLPAPTFTLNPQRQSYVTLPVFVTNLTGNDGPRSVTATLNTVAGVDTATVVATNNGVTFTTPNANPYESCGPNGTRESVPQMAKAGPRSTPDCGVVYKSPSTGYGTQGYPFTANVTWTATYNGQPIGPNPIQMASATHYIPVAEIQSVNNGSG